MEDAKTRSGHRERRSKPRLSDVHRLVDDVVTKHMPEKGDKPRHHQHQEDERRKSGPHKK